MTDSQLPAQPGTAQITIYASATGQILRNITCPDDHVDIQIQTGEAYIDGLFDGKQFYIWNGNACEFPTPASPYQTWDWATAAWVYPFSALAQARSDQAAIISLACQEACYAGVVSSALGSPNTYPTEAQDQANMTASVTASLCPGLPSNWVTPFWCMNPYGVWAHADHTATQIQQAGLDIKAAITAFLIKNTALQAQIVGAATIAEVQAITWS